LGLIFVFFEINKKATAGPGGAFVELSLECIALVIKENV
jgi:hypothetical protein